MQVDPGQELVAGEFIRLFSGALTGRLCGTFCSVLALVPSEARGRRTYPIVQPRNNAIAITARVNTPIQGSRRGVLTSAVVSGEDSASTREAS